MEQIKKLAEDSSLQIKDILEQLKKLQELNDELYESLSKK